MSDMVRKTNIYISNPEAWDAMIVDAENGKVHTVVLRGVEFVKVVRCKDCKWFKEFTDNGVTMGYGCCDNPNIRMAKCPQIDWFCADGKRRE